MNWIDLKIKIEAALPGEVIKMPKGIGCPPPGKITIPKGVTVDLSESDPLPRVQIFSPGDIAIDPALEWWGEESNKITPKNTPKEAISRQNSRQKQ